MLKTYKVVLMICIALIGLFYGITQAGTTAPSEYVDGSAPSSAERISGPLLATACADDEIELNTDIPFIGRCISKDIDPGSESTNISNSFAKLMGGLTRIVMTAVVIVGFMGLLVGGFMIAAQGMNENWLKEGKGLILKVIIGLILLGASGIILNLINPNFFGTSSTPGLIQPFITLLG